MSKSWDLIVCIFTCRQEVGYIPDKLVKAERRIATNPYDTEAWSAIIRNAQVEYSFFPRCLSLLLFFLYKLLNNSWKKKILWITDQSKHKFCECNIICNSSAELVSVIVLFIKNHFGICLDFSLVSWTDKYYDLIYWGFFCSWKRLMTPVRYMNVWSPSFPMLAVTGRYTLNMRLIHITMIHT